MSDWFWDNFPAIMIGICAALILGCVGMIVADAEFESTHVCVQETAPYYHAPTYVMVGKVMVPSGGGTYSDCTAWEPKKGNNASK